MRSLSPARKTLALLLFASSALTAIGLFAPGALSMPEMWGIAIRVMGLVCVVLAIALILWVWRTGRSM